MPVADDIQKSTEMKPVACCIALTIAALAIAAISLGILLLIFVQKYNELTALSEEPLELEFVINSTWNSQPITHPPINITLSWNSYNKAINVKFRAPLYRNPLPPNQNAGMMPQLYNYEVFEIFFLNSKNQYLEVELGPFNQWLVLLLSGQRQAFNTGETLQLSVWNRLINDTWEGVAEIPLAYLPANFSKINAYNIHMEGSVKVYEALNPAPYGVYDKPDFHRLELFRLIDTTKLIPDDYFSSTKPYLDSRYNDVWKGYY